jgi:hypothetical protein
MKNEITVRIMQVGIIMALVSETQGGQGLAAAFIFKIPLQ